MHYNYHKPVKLIGGPESQWMDLLLCECNVSHMRKLQNINLKRNLL